MAKTALTAAGKLAAKQKQKERLARKKLAARRLTPDEEKETIYKCKHLVRCLVLLRRKLIKFLKSWGIDVCPDDDVSDLLKTIRDYNRSIRNFLSLTPNCIEADSEILRKAIFGRNKVCHGNLPEVHREWKGILEAWIKVSLLIGASSLATEMNNTLTYLKSTPSVSAPSSKPAFTISPVIIFQCLAAEGSGWTKSKETAAIALAHYILDIVFEDLAPHVRDFIDENKIRDQWDSNIDVHAHTNLLQEQCCMDDFVIPPGINDEAEFRRLLKTAMDGRHAVCHDQYANIIDNWPMFLKDFIDLLIAVHRPEAAQRIQVKLNLLLSARQKAKNRFRLLNKWRNKVSIKNNPLTYPLGLSSRQSLLKNIRTTI